MGSQRCQEPSDDQHEIIPARKIEEGAESLNRPASLRDGEGQHSRGSAEAYRGAFDHPPSLRANVDSAPVLIGKVEIDVPGMLSGADVDCSFRTIELRPRFEEIER